MLRTSLVSLALIGVLGATGCTYPALTVAEAGVDAPVDRTLDASDVVDDLAHDTHDAQDDVAQDAPADLVVPTDGGCPAGLTACGDGCVDLANSAPHCGACDRPCPAGRVCTGGACACPAGTAECAGVCVDTGMDPANCGACGTTCAFDNATAACMRGACALEACNAGFGDCDRAAHNGCETALDTVSNCNGCGNGCPARPNADPVCAAGRCGIACHAGWGNCDGNDANGCEAALDASLAHCGACGNACPAGVNGAVACVSGRCVITCESGWGNCNSDLRDGCETDLYDNPVNCGACGRRCSVGCCSGLRCVSPCS